MKRVRIDFAAPSFARTLFHTRPATRMLAVVGLALCAAAATVGWQLVAAERAGAVQLAAARARASSAVVLPAAPPQPRVGPAQAGAVNAAVLQLNLPWRALYDAIGAATPPNVALLALEPDARKRSMRITAEVRGGDEMIAYVEQLKRQEWFTTVTLTRHEINDQDPNRPIRFQLDAQWTPAP
jgi:Tfp pilus assembly protein PilN